MEVRVGAREGVGGGVQVGEAVEVVEGPEGAMDWEEVAHMEGVGVSVRGGVALALLVRVGEEVPVLEKEGEPRGVRVGVGAEEVVGPPVTVKEGEGVP